MTDDKNKDDNRDRTHTNMNDEMDYWKAKLGKSGETPPGVRTPGPGKKIAKDLTGKRKK